MSHAKTKKLVSLGCFTLAFVMLLSVLSPLLTLVHAEEATEPADEIQVITPDATESVVVESQEEVVEIQDEAPTMTTGPPEVEDVDSYISEATGEAVVDGYGEDTGLMYQPEGFTWDAAVEPQKIDGKLFWTYDIDGVGEVKGAGKVQMLIDKDPTLPAIIDEGVYEKDEIESIKDENLAILEEVLVENDVEVKEEPTILENPLSLDTVEAATLAQLGITYVDADIEWTDPGTGAISWEKRISVGGRQLPAYCMGANYWSPTKNSDFSGATLYEVGDVQTNASATFKNSEDWKILARIMAYGHNGISRGAGAPNVNYLQTDAALMVYAQKVGLYDRSYDPGDTNGDQWDDRLEALSKGTAAQSLITYAKNHLNDGYTYEIVYLQAADPKYHQSILAISKRSEVKPAELTISKVDAVTGEALAGATFTVSASGFTTQTVTSGSNGKATVNIDGSHVGKTFTVRETKAPTNYVIDQATWTFVATPGGSFSHEFTNTPVPQKIKIRKVDANNTNKGLAGAQFRVTGPAAFGTRTLTAGDDGWTSELTIPNDYLGQQFTVEEIKAPDGYRLATQTKTFTAQKGGNDIFTYTDVPQEPHRLKNRKVNAEDPNEALQGAQFRVSGPAGSTFGTQTFTTGADGYTQEIVIPVKDLGKTFTVEEIKAPYGYHLPTGAAGTRTFVAEDDGRSSFTFEDKPIYAKVRITKVGDAPTGGYTQNGNTITADYESITLRYAVFEIRQNGKVMDTLVCDTNGFAESKPLHLGKYEICEVSVPIGYNPRADFEVTLTPDNMEGEYAIYDSQVTNDPDVGHLLVRKVDADLKADGATVGVAGAKYNVFNEDMTLLTETPLVTDQEGYIRLENFPLGKYFFQEVEAPEGYELDDQIISFTIVKDPEGKNQAVVEEVTDKPLMGDVQVVKTGDGEFTITKTSESSGTTVYQPTPVKGAEFELRAKNDIYQNGVLRAKAGDIIARMKSGEDGIAKITTYAFRSPESRVGDKAADLTTFLNKFYTDTKDKAYPGVYEVIETKAPDGYLVMDPVTFEIGANALRESSDVPVPAYNKVPKREFDFYKLDVVDDQELPDTLIRILDEDMNVIFEGRTPGIEVKEDNDPNNDELVITIENLKEGIYYFQEVEAPFGYVLNPEPQKFEIIGFDEQTGEVEAVMGEMKDEAQMARVSLVKYGEDFKDFTVTQNEETLDVATTYERIPVEGAVFELVANENIKTFSKSQFVKANKGDVVATGTTDKNGELTFTDYTWNGGEETKDAYLGQYIIREVKAPEGYRPLEEDYVLNLTYTTQDEAVQNIKIEFDQKDEPVFFDDAKKGDVEISKTDIVTGEPLPDTKITIYDEDQNEILTGVTNEEGKLTIPDLPEGKYFYQESEAPYGYVIDEGLYEFEIKDGEVTKAVLEDKAVMGDVELKKVGEDKTNFKVKDGELVFDTKPVAGVTYAMVAKEDVRMFDGAKTLRAKAGDIVAYLTTDEEGVAVPEAYYFLDGEDLPSIDDVDVVDTTGMMSEEIMALPVGTIVGRDGVPGTVVKEGGLTSYNPPNGSREDVVEAEKTEEVAILRDLTEVEEGVVREEHAYLGEYYLIEVEAPEEYQMSDTEYPVILEYIDQYIPLVSVEVKAENFLKVGKVEISKTDIATGDPIPGATITIYDKDKNVIFEEKSDENGKVTLDKLPVGEYYYQETKAPKGYDINEELFKFEVKEHGDVVKCNITDRKTPDTGAVGVPTWVGPTLIGTAGAAVLVTLAVIFLKKRKTA